MAFPQHQPNNKNVYCVTGMCFCGAGWVLIYRIHSFLCVLIYFVKWKGNLLSDERQATLTAPMFPYATITDSN